MEIAIDNRNKRKSALIVQVQRIDTDTHTHTDIDTFVGILAACTGSHTKSAQVSRLPNYVILVTVLRSPLLLLFTTKPDHSSLSLRLSLSAVNCCRLVAVMCCEFDSNADLLSACSNINTRLGYSIYRISYMPNTL